jgi:Carboxypeptidase regulatory-like domain
VIRAVLFSFSAAACIYAADDPARFSIQGSVVNSVTGEPLRNASVAVLGTGSQDNNANLSSDGGGRFTIPNLPNGDYTVSAAKQGFSPTAPVHVALSGNQADVTIKLLPFGRITGTIVDDAGDPILNANIQLFRAAVQNGRRVMQPASHATTNDLGEYHVASLPPGRYYVSVTASPEPDGTAYARTFYGGGPDIGSASPLELDAGGSQHADIRMRSVSSYAVRGTIVNLPENLHPYLNIARRDSVLAANEGHATQVDPATGHFEFRGVTPGDWVVTAGCFDQGTQLFGTAEVVVSESDAEGLTVAMGKAAELTGSVRIEGANAPSMNVRSVYLALRPVRDGSQPALGAAVKEDGTFNVPGVQAGEYVLVTRAQEPWYVKSVRMGGREIGGDPFTVNSGGGTAPIEVTLATGGGEINGTVVDGSTPVLEGYVLILGAGQERMLKIDSTGKFHAGALAPGEYTAYAFNNPSEIEYSNPDVMQRFSSARISVTEGARQQTELTLNRTVY